MKITRLRLLGFKSFVEPTELVIEKGLTGVVGPNGCGKSNLLEALRWVMGETSHKSMRAAAMDDVIFSGTTHRPARNAAEVTLFLDNSARTALAEFNDRDVVEITRRIEREAGSAYRINSREARARDIKLLFEDAATGARSPALVRQGQIGEIVNAKPEARRRILEDAAGIAGLHSRRHEAELRLKAAEANLARLADVLGQLGNQVESLKRQARQARRYKELSVDIRKAEALLAHLSWADAQAQVEAEEARFTEALTTLGAAVAAEAQALTQEAALADQLPSLRDNEAIRAAVLTRLKTEQDNFEREAERQRARETELTDRAALLARDIAREVAMVAEARDTIARLEDEIAELVIADDGNAEAEDASRAALRHAEAEMAAADKALADQTHRMAEMRARRRSLEDTLADRREAVARIERQVTALDTQRREIAARAPDAVMLQTTHATGQQLGEALGEIEAQALEADVALKAHAHAATKAREAAQKARLDASALAIERDTLAKLLLPARDPERPPVVEQVVVKSGYEQALAAALGDDLDAPAAADAPVHWRRLEAIAEDAPLPSDAEPLARHVVAPPELTRRLRQIGIVAADRGQRLQAHLKPGQRLVSRDGDLWRWDGFVARAHGTTAAAQRLAERNRLQSIDGRVVEAQAVAERLAAAAEAAEIARAEAEVLERSLRQEWRDTQARLSDVRESLTRIERAARETEARIAGIEEARERSQDELVSAHERLEEIETTLGLIDDEDDPEPLLTAAQATASAKRAAVMEARTRLANLEHLTRQRAERTATAKTDLARWVTRSSGADAQIASLEARRAETAAELATLADLPEMIDDKRRKLLDELARAERERCDAADRLAATDTAHRNAAQALKAAQGEVATAREARARVEARLEGARQRRQEEARRIHEQLDVVPEGCLALAGHEAGAPLPALADVDRSLTRLKADRERLGGVNLQADDELEKLSAQFGSIDAERADVEQAVNKLRGAIGQLNREAKGRLKQAFDIVNGHFQRLFQTLFMGGEARLELIESEEDPLQGGLEIIAKPPGKKPATLSLLSGGEQTLTALSLIFAVFLTNPSPICVLDEVDAPLDDANVDRFCTLMEKMAGETDTRFLVITHHPMTMVRMNRLFGVTMGEKGVSQLVSVDLETAQGFTGHAEAGAA